MERRFSDNLAFVRALLATNLKAMLALRGAFAMQAAFMALNNLTFFVFWWALLHRVPQIRGWSLPDLEVLVLLRAQSPKAPRPVDGCG